MAAGANHPLLRFGIIADVQYADADNGHNYAQTRIRYYRAALEMLRDAVRIWASTSGPKVSFVLQLGDLIDGLNNRIPHPTAPNCASSELALERALEVLNSLACPVYHTIGNHELYNFSREKLKRLDLNTARFCDCWGPKGRFYYHVLVHPKLRIVVLDTYEVSCLGVPTNSKEYQEAFAIISEVNKNEDLNSPPFVVGTDLRFVKYNGGCSQEQLEWLEKVLAEAEDKEENVIVVGHCPLKAGGDNALCWNCTEVSALLDGHSCVLMYLGGHDHDGCILRPEEGPLHITLPGVIETQPSENAFVNASLFLDCLLLEGGSKNCPISEKVLLRFPLDN